MTAGAIHEGWWLGRSFDSVVGPISAEEVVSFGRQFDPQPLHTDPEWAVQGPFSEIIASGIHTLALCWGSWVSLGHLDDLSAGGLGIDFVQFHNPVRAGDILDVHAEVVVLRRTRKGKWLFALAFDVPNRAGEPVISFRSVGLLTGVAPKDSGPVSSCGYLTRTREP